MSNSFRNVAEIDPIGGAQVSATQAISRVDYDFCPLCYGNDISSLGQSSCAEHSLYKPQLPSAIQWQLCRSCQHVHASGFFGEDGLEVLYPQTPLKERAGYDIERQRLEAAKIVHRVARVAKHGVWLDVGFGDGAVLFAADEWGYQAVGLDVRADNVKSMETFGIEAHELCIELHEPDEQCAVVSMNNLLQHVPFPGSAVEHAARLLRPNGVFFVTLPNMDTAVWRVMDKERKNAYWTDLEIYHHFTRRRLYQLLLQHGLTPVDYNVSTRHKASMEVMAIKIAADQDEG